METNRLKLSKNFKPIALCLGLMPLLTSCSDITPENAHSFWHTCLALLIVLGYIVFEFVLMYCVFTDSDDLYKMPKKRKLLPSYLTWLVGGYFGMHRFYLGSIVWGFIMMLMSTTLVASNMYNIMLNFNNPEVLWMNIVNCSLDYYLLLAIGALMAFDFLFWIPYQVYYINHYYYRRHIEEGKIINKRPTQLDNFLSETNERTKILVDQLGQLGETTGYVASRKKETRSIFNPVRWFAGDGSYEYELEKFKDLKEIYDSFEYNVRKLNYEYRRLQDFLSQERSDAYRNLYLAKEMVRSIKSNVTSKEQEVMVDDLASFVYGKVSVPPKMMELNTDIATVSEALSTSFDKFLEADNIIDGIFDIVGNLSERSKKRSQMELVLAEKSQELVNAIAESCSAIDQMQYNMERIVELLGALHAVNKVFVNNYAWLRDRFYHKPGFYDYIFRSKNQEMAKREGFQENLRYLLRVCSEYNKINQQTVN